GRQGRALHFLLGARVELLDEAHDVDAALAQCRADRGRRRGGGGRHLKLDVAEYLLGHWSLLTMALNSIRAGEPWSGMAASHGFTKVSPRRPVQSEARV